VVHAIPLKNLINKSYFASMKPITDNATRKYFCETFIFLLIYYFSFDGESYQSAGSSEYSHEFTYGMANYLGRALTTGCFGSSTCAVKTELMNMDTLTWSRGPDYPFTSE